METPLPVVSLFWRLVKQRRPRLDTVLDMGAGDCRFAKGGDFERYVGVEIDRSRVGSAKLPRNGTLVQGCVFRHEGHDYDACIGNPPYLRHHFIERPWKERTLAALERDLSVKLNGYGNLYLYFMCLGLSKTHEHGLVAVLVPYEWVSRPSAEALRELIRQKRWGVSVYRFRDPVFEDVLTTASISVIDKARHDGRWAYYDIEHDLSVHRRRGVVDSKEGVLGYAKRGKAWALRGLSPGSQKVFALTEGERIHAGLGEKDVVPCVTTLRHVPRSLRILNRAGFEKHFVRSGQRCWLIRSYEPERSAALDSYLESVQPEDRQTYTCLNQDPWFNYRPHPAPKLLISSGFTSHGPKVLVNSVGARAVGSTFGIHSSAELRLRQLQSLFLKTDFEGQLVAHAKTLKKIEVRQINSMLNKFVEGEQGGT